MINKSHFILYVEDQLKSSEFYQKLLNQDPILNVPGMTEFKLTEYSVLGLMPSTGIKKLLENKIDTSILSEGVVKSELYILVDSLKEYIKRATSLNVPILSSAQNRDWGHKVIYLLDPDNYVIAFAEIIDKTK